MEIFQFLLVRLKAMQKAQELQLKEISIPFGAIKSLVQEKEK